jgi:hypothetical protein
MCQQQLELAVYICTVHGLKHLPTTASANMYTSPEQQNGDVGGPHQLIKSAEIPISGK